MCQTPACGRTSASAVTRTVPGRQTRPRSLRTRSTIITFSARSFSERAQLLALVRRPRALDRRAPHGAAGAREEELGREARDRPPRTGDERGAVRRQRLRGGGEEVERVALQPALEAHAEVGLEEVAGGDPRRGTPRPPRRGRPPTGSSASRACRTAAAAAASARRAASCVAPPRDRLLAPRRHERLEPPAPVRVHPQDVVVVGERAVGERHGPWRRRVARLDAVARLEAEEAEPAAADARRRGRGRRLRQLVEHREQVLVRPGDAHGLRAEHRAAARPRPDQRERPLLAAQDQRGRSGRYVGVEPFAEHRGAHPPHPIAGGPADRPPLDDLSTIGAQLVERRVRG